MRVFFWAIVATFFASVASAATVYEYRGNTFSDGSGSLHIRLTIDERFVSGGLSMANLYSNSNEHPDYLLGFETNYFYGDTDYNDLFPNEGYGHIGVWLNKWGNIARWSISSHRTDIRGWQSSNSGDWIIHDDDGPYSSGHFARPGYWSAPMPTPLPASAPLLVAAAAMLALLRLRRTQKIVLT